MPKKINYLSSNEVKNAWLNLIAKLKNIENDSIAFVNSALNFYLEVKNYYKSFDDGLLGAEDFIECFNQLFSFHSITLNLKQGIRFKEVIYGIATYSIDANNNALKRHADILNAGVEDPRKRPHSKTNELQSWFNALAIYLGQLGDRIPIDENVLKTFKNLKDKKDSFLPQLLIDCSEDYFIESVLIFMHQLTNFYANTEDAFECKSSIEELIKKSENLLLQHHIPSIDRFIELAKFAASIPNNEKLHPYISRFIAYVPPGIGDYSKQSPDNRLRYLNSQLSKNETYYKKLRSNYIPSKIPAVISKEIRNEVTIEKKILDLPYLEVENDYLENYFIHITLQLIEDLRKYLLQYPNSIKKEYINQIIKKANNYLYVKNQTSLQKFNKLINSATKKLKNESEKLDKIIEDYVNYVEQIGLNHKLKLAETQQKPTKTKCNRSIKITLSNIQFFSEDYFIQHALLLIDKLTYFYVEDNPDPETKRIIKKLLEKTKELLIQRETPAIDRMLQLAHFMAQHDNQNDRLHEIISLFISSIPPSITKYASQPPNKRQSYLESQITEHKKSYQHLSRNSSPSKMPTFKDTSQVGQISIEEKIADLPYTDFINKTYFVDTQEEYFIKATLDFIKELCDYVIRNPNAGIMHDRQHEIYLILKKTNELLFQRTRPGSVRFKELASFAIHRDTREKGELHQIIRRYVAKEPALGEYGLNEIPVNNRKQFTTTKLLANADYYQNRDYSRSKYKDSDLDIPKFVLAHLVKNHAEETPIFWKLINWLSSIFNRHTLLLKNSSIHQNPGNVEDQHPPSTLVF